MGYIYLVQPECYKNTNTYKIGKTDKNNPRDRIKSYGKNTKTICIIEVDNTAKIEKILIAKCRKLFGEPIQGREYFAGNQDDIKRIVLDCCSEKIDNIVDDEDDIDTEEIEQEFPNYKEDIAFGGSKRLVKLINVGYEYNDVLDHCAFQYISDDKELSDVRLYRDYDCIFIDTLLKHDIIKENDIFDFNNKFIKTINKYKNKYSIMMSSSFEKALSLTMKAYKYKIDTGCTRVLIDLYLSNNSIVNKQIHCNVEKPSNGYDHYTMWSEYCTSIAHIWWEDVARLWECDIKIAKCESLKLEKQIEKETNGGHWFSWSHSYNHIHMLNLEIYRIHGKYYESTYLRTYFPYCIDWITDNSFIIRNRYYHCIDTHIHNHESMEQRTKYGRDYIYNDDTRPFDTDAYNKCIKKYNTLTNGKICINMIKETSALLTESKI